MDVTITHEILRLNSNLQRVPFAVGFKTLPRFPKVQVHGLAIRYTLVKNYKKQIFMDGALTLEAMRSHLKFKIEKLYQSLRTTKWRIGAQEIQ